MYQRKESSTNSYYPAFWYMNVDTPDSLEVLAYRPLDERTEAAFLHEYIHYLQDLTTTVGYARIETIVDQIKWAYNKGQNKRKLTIPLRLNTWNSNILPNLTSLEISKGDFKIHNKQGFEITPSIIKPISFEMINGEFFLDSGIKCQGKVHACFHFEDANGVLHNYRVGELAISESMAYLIENRVYPDVCCKKEEIVLMKWYEKSRNGVLKKNWMI